MSNKDIIDEWFKTRSEIIVLHETNQKSLENLKQDNWKLISQFLLENDVKDINVILKSEQYEINEKKIKNIEKFLNESKKYKELVLDKVEVEYWLDSDNLILDDNQEKREIAIKFILNELDSHISLNKFNDSKELLQGEVRRNDFINSKLKSLEKAYEIFKSDLGILEDLGSFSSAFMNQDLRTFIGTYKSIIDEIKEYKSNNQSKSNSRKDYKFINQFVWNTSKSGIAYENFKKYVEIYLQAIKLNYKKNELFYNLRELIEKHYEN